MKMRRVIAVLVVMVLLLSNANPAYAASVRKYDHIDVRMQNAEFTMTHVTKNLVTGEVVSSDTVTLDCTVVGVKSVSYTQLKGTANEKNWIWTSGFTNDGHGYEFRKMGLSLSTDLSGSYATVVVDLKAKDGTLYEDVTFSFGPKGCLQALYDCDGYRQGFGGGSVGLDFILHENEEAVIVYTDWVVPVKKVWVDSNDQDGIRPDSVQVQLYANGKAVEGALATLNANNGWAYQFKDMEGVDANGDPIVYTVQEVAVPEGYTASVNNTNFTVTNTHTPATVAVSGAKTWEDNEDQDGKRPESITVNLLADGEEVEDVVVTAESGWAWSFVDLPKYAAGEEIVYTVTEDAVEGYETVVNGYNITNTYTPATVTVAGAKTWEDNQNQDGKRPESITVNLLADGEEVEDVVVTAESGWAWSFVDLPKYADGEEIVYTVTEDAVEGYETVVNGYDITNTYTPATVTVAGAKTWEDNEDQDGIRPESITVNLLANGQEVAEAVVTAESQWTWTFAELPKYAAGEEIVYTVTEDAVEGYETVVNGYNITNTHAPTQIDVTVMKLWEDADDQDGKRPASIQVQLYANAVAYGDPITLTADNDWTYTWADLYEKEAGAYIFYTVEEVDVPDGYEVTKEGMLITNTHIPEQITISGAKTWDDNDDQDGIRPESITVNLLANGQEVAEAVVTAEAEWSWSFENLPKYAAGEEIVYTVTEDAVEGYTAAYDGFNITNTHTPTTVAVSGAKTWDDNHDQDGKRPDSITVNLLANGQEVAEAVVTAEAEWSWSFENLPKYAAGEEIVYTVTEDAVEGYTAAYDGYNITNSYDPEKTSVTVTKVWDDGDDVDGLRPDQVTITLYANGLKTDLTLELNAEGKWTGTFADLPKFAGGQEIVYTIEEKAVKEYTTSISGSAEDGFVVTNSYSSNPKTGDENTPVLWGMTMLASLCAMVWLLSEQKKRRQA